MSGWSIRIASPTKSLCPPPRASCLLRTSSFHSGDSSCQEVHSQQTSQHSQIGQRSLSLSLVSEKHSRQRSRELSFFACSISSRFMHTPLRQRQVPRLIDQFDHSINAPVSASISNTRSGFEPYLKAS